MDVTIPDVAADDDDEEEEGVDDPNEDKGADISDETFPNCNNDGVPPRQVLEDASHQADNGFVEDQGDASLGDQRNDMTLTHQANGGFVEDQGDISLGDQRNDMTLTHQADDDFVEDQGGASLGDHHNDTKFGDEADDAFVHMLWRMIRSSLICLLMLGSMTALWSIGVTINLTTTILNVR